MAIFWGTFFPLISELFTGDKSSLAAPWFDRYTTPLAIVLVLFTGIGPLLAWRRVSWDTAKRVFLVPAIVAALAGLGLALFTDAAGKPWALALFAFAAFALTGLAQEFWRGAAARRSLHGGSMPAALVGVVARNRRRYGGYVVHAGIAVLLIGIAASSSFQTNRTCGCAPGESAVVDGHTVTYVRPTVERRPHSPSPPARPLRGREGRQELPCCTRPAASTARPGWKRARSPVTSTANPTARSA